MLPLRHLLLLQLASHQAGNGPKNSGARTRKHPANPDREATVEEEEEWDQVAPVDLEWEGVEDQELGVGL